MSLFGVILVSIVVFAVMSDLQSCSQSIGKHHYVDGWYWSDDSGVKCRNAPEFSKHAEICVER